MYFSRSIIFAVIFAILTMTIDAAHGKEGAIRGLRRLHHKKSNTNSSDDGWSNSSDSLSLSFDEDEEAVLESSVCTILSNTTAFGLCVAYCDDKDCANVKDEEPSGSGRKMAGKKKAKSKKSKKSKKSGKTKIGKSQSCAEIKSNFSNMTGWASFPCEEFDAGPIN